jgi:hypothetical protein
MNYVVPLCKQIGFIHFRCYLSVGASFWSRIHTLTHTLTHTHTLIILLPNTRDHFHLATTTISVIFTQNQFRNPLWCQRLTVHTCLKQAFHTTGDSMFVLLTGTVMYWELYTFWVLFIQYCIFHELKSSYITGHKENYPMPNCATFRMKKCSECAPKCLKAMGSIQLFLRERSCCFCVPGYTPSLPWNFISSPNHWYISGILEVCWKYSSVYSYI